MQEIYSLLTVKALFWYNFKHTKMLYKSYQTDSPSGKAQVIVINSEIAADNGMMADNQITVLFKFFYTRYITVMFQAKLRTLNHFEFLIAKVENFVSFYMQSTNNSSVRHLKKSYKRLT